MVSENISTVERPRRWPRSSESCRRHQWRATRDPCVRFRTLGKVTDLLLQRRQLHHYPTSPRGPLPGGTRPYLYDPTDDKRVPSAAFAIVRWIGFAILCLVPSGFFSKKERRGEPASH